MACGCGEQPIRNRARAARLETASTKQSARAAVIDTSCQQATTNRSNTVQVRQYQHAPTTRPAARLRESATPAAHVTCRPTGATSSWQEVRLASVHAHVNDAHVVVHVDTCMCRVHYPVSVTRCVRRGVRHCMVRRMVETLLRCGGSCWSCSRGRWGLPRETQWSLHSLPDQPGTCVASSPHVLELRVGGCGGKGIIW